MEKRWTYCKEARNGDHETFEAAVEAAKRYAKVHDYDTVNVYQLVAQVVTPVPEYEVKTVQ